MSFAAVIAGVVAIYNILSGIAAIAEDDQTERIAEVLYGIDISAWGWFWLILGIVQLVTAWLIWTRHPLGQMLGLIWAFISASLSVLMIFVAPEWALVVLALSILVIYALVGDRGVRRVGLEEAPTAAAEWCRHRATGSSPGGGTARACSGWANRDRCASTSGVASTCSRRATTSFEEQLAPDVAQVLDGLGQPPGQPPPAPGGGGVDLAGRAALARLLAAGLDEAQRRQAVEGPIDQLARHPPPCPGRRPGPARWRCRSRGGGARPGTPSTAHSLSERVPASHTRSCHRALVSVLLVRPRGSRPMSMTHRPRWRRGVLLILAAACGAVTTTPARRHDRAAGDRGGDGSITVFAAASLTDAFGEIATAFEEANPGASVELNFGASSALREQILAGAPADVFASANTSNMDQVVEAEPARGRAEVFAPNELEIVVPAGNPGDVDGLDDFGNADLIIGLCAEEVPCGQFGREALANARVTPARTPTSPTSAACSPRSRPATSTSGSCTTPTCCPPADQVEGIEVPEDDNVIAEYPIAALSAAQPEGAAASSSSCCPTRGRASWSRTVSCLDDETPAAVDGVRPAGARPPGAPAPGRGWPSPSW